MNSFQLKPLEEIAEHVTVGFVGISSPYFAPDGIPFLRTGNIGTREIISTNLRCVTQNFHNKNGKSALKTGDLIISRVISDEVRAAVVPPHLDGANCGNVIVVRPGENLDSRYLLNFIGLPASQRTLLGSQVGSAQAVVNTTVLKKWRIALPALDEQRRIADILDRADALRVKRRAAIQKLDSLTQSIFIDMFGNPASNPKGWTVGEIGDLLESATYGTSEKSSEMGDLPVLRMNNISSTGEVDLRSLKYMNLDLSKAKSERYLVRKGDVLFNRTNSSDLVGKTAIYRGTRSMAYAGYLIRLRTSDNADPEFLSAFLNTSYTKTNLRKMCKSIIGMANINAKELQAMAVYIPPVSIQREYAKHAQRAEQLKNSYKLSLEHSASLLQSLQHRCFSD